MMKYIFGGDQQQQQEDDTSPAAAVIVPPTTATTTPVPNEQEGDDSWEDNQRLGGICTQRRRSIALGCAILAVVVVAAGLLGFRLGSSDSSTAPISSSDNNATVAPTDNPNKAPTQFPTSSIVWTQVGADIDGEAVYDYSGWSVSMSSDGGRVAIGSIYNDGNGSNSGHVRIYEYDGSFWNQLGIDIDGEAVGDSSGFSVALSGDGRRVAIGANGNDGNGTNSGQVRIYEYDGTSWTQVGSDIDGEAANDQSGASVSLSADGGQVAIGAFRNDGNGNSSGHVRIYEYDGSSWGQLGSDIDGEAVIDQSGRSVSLSTDGRRVAIGADWNGENGDYSGHARVFEYNGSSWFQLGSDIDGKAAGDGFGYSISLSADGGRVAIGAPGNDGNGNLSGHARIFDYNGSSWNQVGSDINGEAAKERSGYSVSLSDDGGRVAIGAPDNEGNGSTAGSVRIYEYDGSSWTQVGKDIYGEAAGDQSGRSVSLSADGGRVAIGAIGAYQDDGNGINSGHVRVYSFP